MNVLNFEWRAREVMASRGMFSTTKLIPLLQQRGVHLSSSQVYRLVTEKPERLNVHVLVALTDILDCTMEELIVKVDLGMVAEPANGTDGDAARNSALSVLKEKGHLPRRAKVLPLAED
jgi:DNA-binding Xre family transcriptional regulator